jgi:hypothetical protein
LGSRALNGKDEGHGKSKNVREDHADIRSGTAMI